MRALGAVGNAAGFDDVAKQTEIGEVEPHIPIPSFVFDEARLYIMPIASMNSNTILSRYAK